MKGDKVEKMVPYRLLLFDRDLVAGNREAIVHLDGIAIDYLAMEALRQTNSKLLQRQDDFNFSTTRKYTWDFPVPVAPIMAIKGRCGHFDDMDPGFGNSLRGNALAEQSEDRTNCYKRYLLRTEGQAT